MSKSLGTVWKLDAHTAKKHEILRTYFEAWLPIMSKFNGRIVYIDGFAGPGSYSGGEDGSPLVVLKAAREHTYPITCNLHCVFVEADPRRFQHLEAALLDIAPTLPSFLTYEVLHGTSDEHLTKAFSVIQGNRPRVDPTLVFIDPFGFSQTPFETIRAILQNARCEVLINFMYEEVNRFLAHDDHADTYDRLFGTSAWRRLSPSLRPGDRKQQIRDIYMRQLRTVATYVHAFEMRNQSNNTDYFLFFATNNLRGLEKMKEAMWKVDETGGYIFSDYKHSKNLLSLFSEHPNLEPLRMLILENFRGQQVSIEALADWVVAETAFLPAHLKGPTLKPMEESGELLVAGGTPRRRKGTFPPGSILKFL